MAGKVAVVVIHGMGSQDKDFANRTKAIIDNRIEKKGKNSADIAWKSIFWSDLIEPRQRKFMDDVVAHKDNNIDFIKLRRFVVSALGDAAAYQNIKGKKSSTYTDVNNRVRASIKELYNNDLGKQSCPLIVMAHSLGGHIMSSYIWDMQSNPLASFSDFENMKHLAGMVTFGCNIPLFSFAYKASDLQPIKFPGESLSPADKRRAAWLNFYDADDVLGYPLGQLNSKYKFIKDKDINSGNLFTSWNPLSHNGYWTDRDMIKPVSNLIAKFL